MNSLDTLRSAEDVMRYTRREFGKLALAGLPAAALIERPAFGSMFLQAKPNSKWGGVQIGVITYSYRSMPDQSAEATLKYIVDSSLSATELMDGPVENFLGRPAPAGRGFGGGGGGRRGGGEAPAGPTPYEQLMAGTMPTCTPSEGRPGGGGTPGGGAPGGGAPGAAAG